MKGRQLLMSAMIGAMAFGLMAGSANAEVTPYGFIHWSGSYSTSAIPTGNIAFYAQTGMDPAFNMTANFSRFGLKIKGLDTDKHAINGKIELDFYGGGSNSKANPRMRVAAVEMTWKEMDLTIMAGQHWDVVSPLLPSTVSVGIMWYAGNLGYRHPQLRITKGFGPLTVKLAALRPMININDTGYSFETPMIQGSVGYAVPMGEKKGYVGLSGHWSQDEVGASNAKMYYEAHALSLELSVPIGDMAAFKAEVYKGTNADIVMGTIGQSGIVGNDTLNSQGGWAMVTLNVAEGTKVNLIGAIDTVQDDQLGTGGRSQNVGASLNLMTKIMEKVSLGLEVSQWSTQYKNADDAEALRFDTSLKYAF